MVHFSAYIVAVFLPFLYSMVYYNIDPSDCLGILGGVFVWMTAEYVFHRFAFHNSKLIPRTYILLAYNHAKHHSDPCTKKDLLLPLRLTIPVAFIIAAVAWLIIGLPFATFLLLGMFLGLAFYEFVHYQAHNKFYNVWPLNALTRRHLRHHYENEDALFGVTSPVMDWLFGTNQ
jgi:sterol desaturase/sphingolipid hydroxylase (fatty acid hydroxylase superfamily)